MKAKVMKIVLMITTKKNAFHVMVHDEVAIYVIVQYTSFVNVAYLLHFIL